MTANSSSKYTGALIVPEGKDAKENNALMLL
jgi:hypothetical protein